MANTVHPTPPSPSPQPQANPASSPVQTARDPHQREANARLEEGKIERSHRRDEQQDQRDDRKGEGSEHLHSEPNVPGAGAIGEATRPPGLAPEAGPYWPPGTAPHVNAPKSPIEPVIDTTQPEVLTPPAYTYGAVAEDETTKGNPSVPRDTVVIWRERHPVTNKFQDFTARVLGGDGDKLHLHLFGNIGSENRERRSVGKLEGDRNGEGSGWRLADEGEHAERERAERGEAATSSKVRDEPHGRDEREHAGSKVRDDGKRQENHR